MMMRAAAPATESNVACQSNTDRTFYSFFATGTPQHLNGSAAGPRPPSIAKQMPKALILSNIRRDH